MSSIWTTSERKAWVWQLKGMKPPGIIRDNSRPLLAWFTKEESARILDISVAAFLKNWERYANDRARKSVQHGSKTRTYYHFRSLMDTWHDTKMSSAKNADPLLQGAVTPALEDYRRARASQEHMKLQEMQEKYLNVDEFIDDLGLVAQIFRRMQVKVRREYGDGAASVVGAALDEIERRFEKIANRDDSEQTDHPQTDKDGPISETPNDA